ncbi:MAG: LamG-like jellyroll fold domain-containing protein [Verrucomicrobiota bacterium]
MKKNVAVNDGGHQVSIAGKFVVTLALLLGLSILPAMARSRPARPALPEGESLIFRANDLKTNLVAEAVSGTVYLKGVQLAESWSGESLLMTGATRSYCMIPAKGTRKRPNFLPNTGSIRLWFSTAWSSTALGGQGPGTHARLLEIARVNARTPTGFALYFDPDGNTVYLSAYHAGQAVDIVHATVALEKDVFHQFGVVYGPEAVTLILDGKTIATNRGLPALAHPADLDNWICYMGANAGGLEKLQGQLDEIYFFPYACTEAQFGWDYQSQSLLAAMGPISVQESIAQYRTLRRHRGPQRAEADGAPSPPDPGSGSGGSSTNDSFFFSSWIESFPTNYLRFSKIAYDTNGIALTIAGGETNGVYDLYGTSTLGPSNAASATWTWLLRTAPGETNLMLADAGLAYECFIVGRTNATNGHVLSYAFEQLVSHGNSDANSNGVEDAWEFTWFNGLLNALTLNADPDRDGVSNLMEYQAGANPFDPASVSNLLTASWRFDSTNWVGEQGQLPTYASGVTLTNGASTNALRIAAGLSNGVAYADLKPEGTANLNCQQGTVRCWFQPQWSGTLSNMVLLQTGDGSNDWKLGITGNGTNLCFGTSQNGTNQTNISAAIAWSNSIWHQLVLTYNRTSSQIYVDAQLVATNIGVTYIPTIAQRAAGLIIGNDRTGQCPLPGLLDELELYNYPLDQTTIAADYVSFLFRNPAFDSNNNGIPDWWEWQTYGHLLTNSVVTNSGLAIRITYPNANSFAP